ncbi:cadherin-like beta sandwich domain-containing protein [Clostridium sp. C2-6-12]|uniref:cadherin-like beta sandwich domain-containing protein n=1 Tax=Clostridium sp. C2-6-12 TaxID=2698832 RepID=UPI001368E796|nr:cadherin-like beta sandwich domain-containing protein [Clostridium sp. C2-6-12]
MNKSIKRMISFVLALSVVSAVAPAANMNLLTTITYGATNTTDALSSLKLESSGGSNIKLYNNDNYSSSSKINSSDISKGSTYYAKTEFRTVSISADGPSSSYIKVFKGTSSSAKGKNINSDISIDEASTTTLVIRVYSETPESNVRYDNKDKVLSEYRIKVKCTSGSSNSSNAEASSYDNIYLDKLSVNGENISLSQSTVSYTYSVPDNMSSVTIRAVPQSSSDIVRIDGSRVYEEDDYKRTVSLSSGLNEIKIEVEDKDNNDNRTYTLKITREGTGISYGNLSDTKYNKNQWVQVNANWQYIDETGQPKKNTLFTDPVNSKTYYLQYNGFMATEWNKIGVNWYYFGANGQMHTGWVNVNGKWYYLDWNGIMKTGWILDGGKYYYLYNDGSMAANTQIDQYVLGSNGAWIQ